MAERRAHGVGEARFDAPGSVLHMSAERLVAEFIVLNMTWQHDWSEELLKHQRLLADSRLPDKVKKRLLWQLFIDLTNLSQRGRTLDRIGKATLSVPWERVARMAAQLLAYFREHLGTQALELSVLTQWLWGTLVHMRQRGGVLHAELVNYAADGNVWALANLGGRREWMPRMYQYGPHPVMLTLGRQSGFDKLNGTTRPAWYEQWP